MRVAAGLQQNGRAWLPLQPRQLSTSTLRLTTSVVCPAGRAEWQWDVSSRTHSTCSSSKTRWGSNEEEGSRTKTKWAATVAAGSCLLVAAALSATRCGTRSEERGSSCGSAQGVVEREKTKRRLLHPPLRSTSTSFLVHCLSTRAASTTFCEEAPHAAKRPLAPAPGSEAPTAPATTDVVINNLPAPPPPPSKTSKMQPHRHDSRGAPGSSANPEWDSSVTHQPALARSFHNEKPQKRDRDKNDFMIISGNANPRLARKIARHLGVELSPVTLTRFKDGETRLHIQESCRGKDIFIIQPTCPSKQGSVNENVMDLLFMISTARRASAKRITAVVPYYGYARADRKNSSRVPIAAADVAEMLIAMGCDRVVSVDLHNGAIQGFFPPRIPLDNLSAMSIGVEYFASELQVDKSVVVISPDAGGVFRARQFQAKLIKMGHTEAKLAMISKTRSQPNKIATMDLIGDVDGRDVIIVDDMVDTAGTLCEAAKHLKQHGAKRIYAFATHGLLSDNALEKIANSQLEMLVVTDSINGDDGRYKVKNIKIASIAVLVADGLRRIYLNESLSWE